MTAIVKKLKYRTNEGSTITADDVPTGLAIEALLLSATESEKTKILKRLNSGEDGVTEIPSKLAQKWCDEHELCLELDGPEDIASKAYVAGFMHTDDRDNRLIEAIAHTANDQLTLLHKIHDELEQAGCLDCLSIEVKDALVTDRAYEVGHF